MYRFIKVPNIGLQNVHSMPQQKMLKFSMNICSFCHFPHHKNINIMVQSTYKKSIFQNTNTSSVSIINKKSSLSSNQWHHVNKSVIKTQNNRNVNTTNSIVQPNNDVNEEMELDPENDLTSMLNIEPLKHKRVLLNNIPIACKSNIKSEVIQDENMEPYRSKSRKKKFIDEKQKEFVSETQEENSPTTNVDSMLNEFSLYMQMCMKNGLVNRAHNTLTYCKNKNSTGVDYSLLYNSLLDVYGSKGNLCKILEILKLMHKDSVKPNAQSFVSIFECVYKIKNNSHKMGTLKKMHSEMIANGITFEEIINVGKFKGHQLENVLSVIKLLDPTFVPIFKLPDLSYHCKLLERIDSKTIRIKNPVKGILSLDQLKDGFKQQMHAELEGEITINSIAKQHPIENVLSYREKLNELEQYWRSNVDTVFEKNLKVLKLREQHSNIKTMILCPFLEIIPKKYYVNAIMREIRYLGEGSESFSLASSALYMMLGRYMFKKFEIQEKIQDDVLTKTTEIYMKYLNWYVEDEKNHNSRVAWEIFKQATANHGASSENTNIEWPKAIYYQIGKFLYDIILNDVKINVGEANFEGKARYIPAFYTLFRTKTNRMVEEIKPHPLLAKLYRDCQFSTLVFDANLIPSLCPPRPWTSLSDGGYLITRTDFMRTSSTSNMGMEYLKETPTRHYYPSFDSLNQLGSVPWVVNTTLLDIIIKVFQEGGSVKLDVPQHPSILPPLPLLKPDSTQEEKAEISKQRLSLKRQKSEMYSLWCDALYKLSLANHFRDRIFWLPHNMDFRGRVYPVPPHLSHLGADLSRAILVFAKGEPLGPNGLNWLKIHTINLTGLKKKNSIKERLEFANDNLDKILDSAHYPLTGQMWWAESDEPWQTLAACMEINNALKSPNVEEYICQFPIHQDGSCNGLQHYAALGKDEIGAKSVNLAPSEHPQDVYSVVATMVNEKREIDAANGNKIAQVLQGFVSRKVIKQTVMTTVYGVTKFGARLQILKQLKDLKDFPEEHLWAASWYLVANTFNSLQTMFTSAKEIQEWLTECARIISIDFNQSVEWVTQLGLPVIQPYFKYRNSSNHNKKPLMTRTQSEKVDTIKQKNAFPPNFVHSLDSTHMMLTGLFCENEGITFMSVHDCFWTHPSTVEIMNKVCRQQFVVLHSQPILENLSEFFIKKYINEFRSGKSKKPLTMNPKYIECFQKIPQKGNFQLDKVLSSVYFFS